MLYDPKWTPPATEIQLESWQKLLLEAADLIEKHGWIKGALGYEGVGFCVVGAMRDAVNRHTGYAVAYQKVSDAIGTRIIPDWNDNECKSREEAVRTLRKVAKSC